MCESCNFSEKLYNSFNVKAPHLYKVIIIVHFSYARIIEGMYRLNLKIKK